MKIISKVCAAIILMIICFSNISYADTYGRIITFDNNKIMVYQQLDNMRLVTARRQLLASLETYTHLDTEETTKVMPNNIEVCFILDRSGSMSSNVGDGKKRIDVLKEAIVELLDKLHSTFQGESQFKVSAAKFGSDVGTLFDFTNYTGDNINNIKEKIDGLSTSGGTETAEAIKYATENIWPKADGTDTNKFTILITDGAASKISAVNPEIDNLKEKTGSSFFTLFVGLSEEAAKTYKVSSFDKRSGGETKELAYFYDNSDKLLFCNDQNFKEALTVDAFNFIIDAEVNANTLVTEVVSSMNTKMGDVNNFYCEVDDELLNGAILEMEYSFTIVSTKELEEIEVVTVLDDLGCDLNQQLISSEYTNYDYGWRKVNDNLIRTIIKPTMEKDEYNKYKAISIKLILTRIISITSDIANIENKADIRLKTKEGKEFNTVDAIDDGEIDEEVMVERDENGEVIRIAGKILPPSFTITPPLGSNKYEKSSIIVAITALVLISINIIGIKRKIKTK